MKRYILVKTYPGSPKLGALATEEMGVTQRGYRISYSGEFFWRIPEDVEDQPEFWLELTEDDVIPNAAEAMARVWLHQNELCNAYQANLNKAFEKVYQKALSDLGKRTTNEA